MKGALIYSLLQQSIHIVIDIVVLNIRKASTYYRLAADSCSIQQYLQHYYQNLRLLELYNLHRIKNKNYWNNQYYNVLLESCAHPGGPSRQTIYRN